MALTFGVIEAIILFLYMKLVVSDQYNFTFNGFHGSNLSLDGVAKIESNGLLQLTNTTELEMGHAFYPLRLHLKSDSNDNFSFSTTFVFAIVPTLPDLGGHGLAFIVSPSKEIQGAIPSEYLGLLNPANNGNISNHLLAIELDTIMSPEFEDINNNHVGIDINSLKSEKSAPAAYFTAKNGENRSLNLISGDPIQVWVDYDGTGKQLNVTLSPLNIGYVAKKPDMPLLSYDIDLSLVFLDNVYLGFSSATGAVSTSSHYLLGWSFMMNGEAQLLDRSRLPSIPRRKSRMGIRKELAIGMSTAIIFFVLITIYGSVYMIRKKMYSEVVEDWEREYGSHRFSYKDLFMATKGFKDKELLGTGGFGSVFRGLLPNSNTEVAVKRVSHDSKQGLREFIAELASLGRLRHRNLVQLLGYCRLKGELLLVYDFMPNGSLDKLIFGQSKSNLNWVQRFRALRGVASGLLYLHEEWEQVVVHRDVKASNVLLDSDFNGRLGDFGLARLYDHGTNPQTTHVVGTVGYLAPELSRTGKATTSTDVFAFGALLLEVACGRRPLEPQASAEELILVEWVFDCWKKGWILESSDPKLGGEYILEEMELVLKLGLLCSHPVPQSRPSMRQVMQFLDGDVPLPEISPHGLSDGGFGGMDKEGFGAYFLSYASSMEKMPTGSISVNNSVLSGGR